MGVGKNGHNQDDDRQKVEQVGGDECRRLTASGDGGQKNHFVGLVHGVFQCRLLTIHPYPGCLNTSCKIGSERLVSRVNDTANGRRGDVDPGSSGDLTKTCEQSKLGHTGGA